MRPGTIPCSDGLCGGCDRCLAKQGYERCEKCGEHDCECQTAEDLEAVNGLIEDVANIRDRLAAMPVAIMPREAMHRVDNELCRLQTAAEKYLKENE